MFLGLLIGALAVIGVLIFSYERTLKLVRPSENTFPAFTPYEQILSKDTTPNEGGPTEPVFSEDQFRTMFMNEDEEDVKHLLESGQITKDQIPDVLDALGVVHEVNFT